MADQILGVNYADIGFVFTGGTLMGPEIDVGSLADDGNDPPAYYRFTINQGAQTITVAADAVMGVSTPVVAVDTGP